jgi:hypothetical protein
MKADIRYWVASCEPCQQRKTPNNLKPTELTPIPVGQPFDLIAMDIVGPLPKTKNNNHYLLVITEYLTKWVEAFPIPNDESITIAKILVNEIFSRYGAPKRLLSDRGTNFLSGLIADICTIMGIERRFTTAYHPQTDGLTERFNHTIASMISKYVSNDQNDWDEFIPFVLSAYRNSPQESTGEKPSYLMFGRDVRLPMDVSLDPQPSTKIDPLDYRAELITRLERAWSLARENILRAQQRQIANYRNTGSNREFQIGQQVWIYTPKVRKGTVRKFAKNWFGPYRIIEKLSNINYRVRSNGNQIVEQVVHIARMKPYFDPKDRPSPFVPPLEEKFEIELQDSELPEGIIFEDLSSNEPTNETEISPMEIEDDFNEGREKTSAPQSIPFKKSSPTAERNEVPTITSKPTPSNAPIPPINIENSPPQRPDATAITNSQLPTRSDRPLDSPTSKSPAPALRRSTRPPKPKPPKLLPEIEPQRRRNPPLPNPRPEITGKRGTQTGYEYQFKFANGTSKWIANPRDRSLQELIRRYEKQWRKFGRT